jgi:hypothetical protein
MPLQPLEAKIIAGFSAIIAVAAAKARIIADFSAIIAAPAARGENYSWFFSYNSLPSRPRREL